MTHEQLSAEHLNEEWRLALLYADPTAGTAHLRFARAIIAQDRALRQAGQGPDPVAAQAAKSIRFGTNEQRMRPLETSTVPQPAQAVKPICDACGYEQGKAGVSCGTCQPEHKGNVV